MKQKITKTETTTVLKLNINQILATSSWLKRHVKTCSAVADGANLNFLQISFDESANTGIGKNIFATCECGAIEDITDYGSW